MSIKKDWQIIIGIVELNKKGGIKIKKCTQQWIKIDYFLEKGIIKLEKKYIKIIKIKPINFILKSDLEKKSILNSYKIFLKTCSFDFQIIVKSNKLNLNNYIKNINLENFLSQKYIYFLKEKNKTQKLLKKDFYIVIKDEQVNLLNEKYLKIKECLNRCGNKVEEIEKEEMEKIIKSFYKEVIV